jgi:hypothetical protein
MAQESITRSFGLITQYNPLSVAPGALLKADNANIRREHIIENRRGYKQYGTVSNTVSQMISYGTTVLNNNSDKVSYDNGSGTFANYSGTYSPPTSRKMRFDSANLNLYVTTTAGIKVFQDVAGTAAREAGAPRCLDLSFTLTGASGFLANNAQVAYRSIFERIDANSNVLIGYPSQRLWANNAAGGTRNVIITSYLPSDVVAGDFFKLYRTATDTSGATSDTAGDSMRLVYKYEVTSTDITNGYVTITDSLIDALQAVNEELYTNTTQQGLGQANDKPPLSKDLALFKSQFMFYANTQTKQILYATLIGVSGLSGKTVTVGGITYNFGASEIISGGGSPQVQVFSTGVLAVDITNTAQSFCRVVNRYASNTTIYAYYLSGPDSLPGQILFQARSLGASAFTFNVSDSAIQSMFSPTPPINPATDTLLTSSNDVRKNGIYYSKAQQVEHVPALNYFPVGPSNKEILRVVALRDSLIIIKEEGVYRLTGEDPNSFTVVPLDLTVSCKGADSVASLNNQVYMLSNQGVVAISDTGIEVVSRPIEGDITRLVTYTNITTLSYGIGYESDKSYLLSVPALSSDSVATQTYVYNIFTRCWTRYTFPISCGIVDPTKDKIYFGKPSSSTVFVERKDFDSSDYCDPEYSITLTAKTTSTVTFTLASATPDVGWVIQQGGFNNTITSVVSAGVNSWTATMLYSVADSWTLAAATAFPSYTMEIQWDTWSAGQPGLIKQVRQFDILGDNILGNNSSSSVIATFVSDFDDTSNEVTISTAAFAWGSGPWGQFAWGGLKDNYSYPTFLPKNAQYCRILNPGVKHKNAFEKLSISGCSLTYEMISERTGK